ncbi:galactose-binding like protein [Conidiobolus coronatus NRRL 28638]|uniref:Galactose-binding like protein n=1 Tax=Conidiobolus coronatus (strain ATCC 28846 / CBS 209.66 / NRRL 28638) TaxID=796925 RepID=A0A137P0K9_CONC2|nr:galactose-binding like protein [Conidiobolus coronatus NRRL 28638]|eukprot:KXN68399.1 galactose-binding like protein [Conidiobolus coronatus NRRL 28638]
MSNSHSIFNSSDLFQNNTQSDSNSSSPASNANTLDITPIQVDIDLNSSSQANMQNTADLEINLTDELGLDINSGSGSAMGVDNLSNFSSGGGGSQLDLSNNSREYFGEEVENDDDSNIGMTTKRGFVETKGYETDITSECKLRVSSYKYGYPPTEMIDNSLETYWQSEGQLPHTIILKYSRQILLSKLKIYFDFPMDESYTPNLFTISLGNRINDYKELTKVKGEVQPKWIEVNCKLFNNNRPIPTFNIKLTILNNMEDGRDSHLRQIRIFELKEFDNIEKISKKIKGTTEVDDGTDNFNLGGISGLERIRI